MARTHTICAHPNESKYNTKLVKIRNKSLNFNGTQLKKKKQSAFSLSRVPNSFNPHATDFKILCWLKTKDPKSFRKIM